MDNMEMKNLCELVWLLKHTPPPIGFNRKPMTIGQQHVVDSLYDTIWFPDDYAATININNGQ